MKKSILISILLCGTMLCACSSKKNESENSIIQHESEIAETTEITTEFIDMSIADTPEEMAARLVESVAGFDETAYISCFPDTYSRNSYDGITQDFYMHCRADGLDYKSKRSLQDFKVYMYNDKRYEEGRVSAIAFLKESDIIKLHINMEFDISREGFYITDVISSEAGEGGTSEEIIIEQGGKLVDYSEVFK